MKNIGPNTSESNRDKIANILNLQRTAYWVPEDFVSPEDVELPGGIFHYKILAQFLCIA